MKQLISKLLVYGFVIFLSFSSTPFILKNLNVSAILGFKIILIYFFIILFLGTLISKITFYVHIKNGFKILDLNTSKKEQILNSISKTLIVLFIYFSITYIITFYNNIFLNLNISTGIKNSCSYISKIFLLSLPFSAFEITFFEYCNFLKTTKTSFILIFSKFIIGIIFSMLFTSIFDINGFLYTKIIIDVLFLPYYIIKLKTIAKLSKNNHLNLQ